MKRFDLKSCVSSPMSPDSAAVTLPEATGAATSIRLNVDDDIADLKPFLPHLQSVILVFPSFRDGRAFTQARALREKLKFAGEILAEGHPLPDQIDFMRRCGFDAVLLEDDAACTAWAAHKTHFPQNYQNRFFPSESPQG
ncbi:Oxidoreductase [Acetobacteraceae bacterium EV16G]|uniref:Oxidoreductase n=1 Tax=Sorlinia euscelidii TaxID=3081148 RepID=A0ABU7U3F4_9PROT